MGGKKHFSTWEQMMFLPAGISMTTDTQHRLSLSPDLTCQQCKLGKLPQNLQDRGQLSFPRVKANCTQLAEGRPGLWPLPSAKPAEFRVKIKGAQSKDKGGARRVGGNQCICRRHPGSSMGSPSPPTAMRQLQVWARRPTFFTCNFSTFGLLSKIYSDSGDTVPGPRLQFPYAPSHQAGGGCSPSCQSNRA